jgi:hypothetical protein
MTHTTGTRSPVVEHLARELVGSLRKSRAGITEVLDVLYGTRMVLINRLFEPWIGKECPFSRENFQNLRTREWTMVESLLAPSGDRTPPLDPGKLADLKCTIVHDVSESGATLSEVFEAIYEARLAFVDRLFKKWKGKKCPVSRLDFQMLHWSEMTVARWLLFPWEDKTCPTCPKPDAHPHKTSHRHR